MVKDKNKYKRVMTVDFDKWRDEDDDGKLDVDRSKWLVGGERRHTHLGSS